MLVFLQLLISIVSNGQKVENIKLGCSPKTEKNSVLKEIGSEKFEDFSDLGLSWSFIGTQKIIAKNGDIYLKGDIYSPRGGQLNVIENKLEACEKENLKLKKIISTLYDRTIVIIYLSLQLETSPEMIVGDSMQARSFPIFLMVINLILVGVLVGLISLAMFRVKI